MSSEEQLTDIALYNEFIDPRDRDRARKMTRGQLRSLVARSRKKSETHVPLTDEEIANRLYDYFHGLSGADSDTRLLAQILEEQRRTSATLRNINNVVTLIGVLILLSVVAGCIVALTGGSLF